MTGSRTQYEYDFMLQVQLGRIAGHSVIHKIGKNDVVPSGSWAFVDELGHTTWPISVATTIRVKAGNVADTAAGAGAREVTVRGIDTTLDEVEVKIVTAGASASTSTTELFWRVEESWVSSCGTYGGANVADIILEKSAGGDLLLIGADDGQSESALFTIPQHKIGVLLSLAAQVDAQKHADLRIFTRENFTTTSAPVSSKRLRLSFNGVEGLLEHHPRTPMLTMQPLTDIWVEALGDGSTVEVSADLEILLIDL